MIKINLLKGTQSKRGGGFFSSGKLVKTGTAVLVAIAVAGVGMVGMRWWLNRFSSPRSATVVMAPKEVTEKKAVSETTAAAPQAAPVSKAVSGTAVAQQAVHHGRDTGKPVMPKTVATVQKTLLPASSSYSDMSGVERINYEITFTRRVLQEFMGALPGEIEFSSLSIDSFTTVSAAGSGLTRELVSTLFSNLRRSPMQLLGPPSSYIDANGPEKYRFVFVVKPFFGMNEDDSLQATGRFVSLKKMPVLLSTFSKLAVRNGLHLRHGLSNRVARKTGSYAQLVYHLTCSGTYRHFVKFVLDADAAHVPCAFTAVRLASRSGAVVDIDADVIFTMLK